MYFVFIHITGQRRSILYTSLEAHMAILAVSWHKGVI